jgi:hypothetical protein
MPTCFYISEYSELLFDQSQIGRVGGFWFFIKFFYFGIFAVLELLPFD